MTAFGGLLVIPMMNAITPSVDVPDADLLVMLCAVAFVHTLSAPYAIVLSGLGLLRAQFMSAAAMAVANIALGLHFVVDRGDWPGNRHRGVPDASHPLTLDVRDPSQSRHTAPCLTEQPVQSAGARGGSRSTMVVLDDDEAIYLKCDGAASSVSITRRGWSGPMTMPSLRSTPEWRQGAGSSRSSASHCSAGDQRAQPLSTSVEATVSSSAAFGIPDSMPPAGWIRIARTSLLAAMSSDQATPRTWRSRSG